VSELDRFAVTYVPPTGEFMVYDTTGRFCHGMPMTCADEAAVLRHATNVLRDEWAHGRVGTA
jgi:hypothetical protein